MSTEQTAGGTQAAWASDLFRAVEDLGYLVEAMGPASIRISNGYVTLEISSVLISGAFLRSMLSPSGRLSALDADAPRSEPIA